MVSSFFYGYLLTLLNVVENAVVCNVNLKIKTHRFCFQRINVIMQTVFIQRVIKHLFNSIYLQWQYIYDPMTSSMFSAEIIESRWAPYKPVTTFVKHCKETTLAHTNYCTSKW